MSAFAGIEGAITQWEGIKIYPCDVSKLNKWALPKYVEREAENGDVRSVQVITLQDVWTWLEEAYGGIAQYSGLRMASWCPVDHDPVPPGVIRALKQYDSRPIAMSRFGERALQQFDFDPLYVPHGVDTKVMAPRHDASDVIREAMDIPKDSFLFGMVAANQGQAPPRKAFPQVFEAFAIFRQHHDDAFLYIHTDWMGLNKGLNLVALSQVYGIYDYVKYVKSEPYWFGEVDQLQMSYIYSMMDCLLNPSYGEGFGVPIIEAQACGTPVIVTNWTAMPELVGAGWTVEGDPWYNPGAASRWKLVSIYDLVDKMEEAYEKRGDEQLRKRARVFAEQYDVDLVTEKFWKPTLEALEKPREVAPLNRAMARRHRKRQKSAA
jgi:glycosyltransferase involved in cell wall biosynthesis